ncbi:MAG: plasma-membrane proton-efflux P-type ATPase [Alphaproteobacteria bacterium]|nr:plasma-membrane proton-efflux P-type ATPase [Alphaproteobacteria bacterium]
MSADPPPPRTRSAPETPPTDRATGLSAADAAARLARDGPNEVAEEKPHPLRQFAAKFWSLSAWMIEAIALLSAFLGKWTDCAVASALLVVNALIGFLQEQRASAAVSALRRRLQVQARVLREGAWRLVEARELVSGDIVRLRAGDFVPADVVLIDGTLRVDQSSLTGESREVARGAGDTAYSGSVVRHGEATGQTIATGARTYFGRTTQLVETARPKLHVEEIVRRVVRWLLLIVGALLTVAVGTAMIVGTPLLDIVPLALVLLMGAVPVALPVMFTVSMAVGAMELARAGALVTRLAAAEDAATMNVLCADKTGTLTFNRLSFAGTTPQMGFTEDDVLRTAAFASNAANQDPIDLAFLNAAVERKLLPQDARVVSFVPFSPDTRRTEAIIETGGTTVRAVKGALRTVASAARVSAAELAALESGADAAARQGYRILAVTRADGDGPLHLVGTAMLYDAPRPDSRKLIDDLRSLGIAVKMLTGDALPVAQQIATELDLGEVARAPELRAAGPNAVAAIEHAGGYAEIFPEDKFAIVQGLQAAGHVVGMTGDGVNDAPALRQAEIGIAVGGATDVAKGAASIVLTTAGLGSIVALVRNGRAIYQRVLTWIINKISRTLLKSGFVVAAYLATGRLVISALGILLLTFMTDFAKIALSTDRTRPSQQPESWNIGPLAVLGALMGLLMLAEALALLSWGWRGFELSSGGHGLRTFAFETLLAFAVFSIVSIRERHAFWSSRPSLALTTALGADAAVGILLSFTGIGEMRPLPPGETAAIFGYAAACCLLLNDAVKITYLRWSEARRTK